MRNFSNIALTCRVKVVDAKGIREVTNFEKTETMDLL